MRAGRLARWTATFEQWAEIAAAPAPPDPLADDPLAAPGGDPLGDSRAWVARFSRRANLRPRRQKEERQAEATVAVGWFELRVRGDAQTRAVRPEGWRVLIDERLYNIRGVTDFEGRGRELIFDLEAGKAS